MLDVDVLNYKLTSVQYFENVRGSNVRRGNVQIPNQHRSKTAFRTRKTRRTFFIQFTSSKTNCHRLNALVADVEKGTMARCISFKMS